MGIWKKSQKNLELVKLLHYFSTKHKCHQCRKFCRHCNKQYSNQSNSRQIYYCCKRLSDQGVRDANAFFQINTISCNFNNALGVVGEVMKERRRRERERLINLSTCGCVIQLYLWENTRFIEIREFGWGFFNADVIINIPPAFFSLQKSGLVRVYLTSVFLLLSVPRCFGDQKSSGSKTNEPLATSSFHQFY